MSQRGNRGRSNYRGNFNRGRSNSRSQPQQQQAPPRRRSIEEMEADAMRAEANKQAQIDEVKSKPSKPVDQEKKQNLINKGAQWFNKFFGGIKRKERGNMKLEFNDELDLELMDVYNYKLSNLAFTKNYYEAFHVSISPDFFRVYLNGLLGIKLLKANTDSSKVVMKEFLPLTSLDLKVPKNLGAIIDCIGKTDVGNDNVVRIVGQNSIIKQSFFKAVVLCASFDKSKFFNNMLFQEGVTFQNIENLVKQKYLKPNTVTFYTKDQAGLALMHEAGRKAIGIVNNSDLQVGNENDITYVRVPYLDPKFHNNIDELLKWELKVRKFFVTTQIKPDDYAVILSYVFMGWFPLKFIINTSKTFKQIDNQFDGTIFANITPKKMLEDRGWYSMEDFCDDRQLYHNIVSVFDYYKSSIEPIYDDIFHMVRYNPSEFGNAAQTVVINSRTGSYLNFKIHDFKIEMADNIKPGNCYTKMSEEEAIIGSVFTFNNGIQLDSSYDIHTIGSAKEIRLAYLGHDFK